MKEEPHHSDRDRDRDRDLERDIRSGRKFRLFEAIGRLGGGDLLKGASPVTLKRQAELQLRQYLESQLDDCEGALRTVLIRRVTESRTLLDMGYEQPLTALYALVHRVIDSKAHLERLVRDVDMEWGRANQELPCFQREGRPPEPHDPYTCASVRCALRQLIDKLGGE